MILFGWRGVTSSTERGNFHCPNCGGPEPYQGKRVRRFFTLYFIPVIPLETLGEYVQCGTCNGQFKPEVLAADPNAGQAEFLKQFQFALLRVITCVMMVDGPMDSEKTQAIRQLILQLTNSDTSDEAVQAAARVCQPTAQAIQEALAPIAAHLNDNGKELVVRAAVLAASTHGSDQSEERPLITAVTSSLGMTAAHVSGLLRSLGTDT